jgi:hypothetical protein
LDRSTTRSSFWEEGEHDRTASQIGELLPVAKCSIAGDSGEFEVGRHFTNRRAWRRSGRRGLGLLRGGCVRQRAEKHESTHEADDGLFHVISEQGFSA